MASIKLNDAELKQLRGVRPEVFMLYVMIRQRMDYSTGLVGAVKGRLVSWQALREDMYVDPMPGIKGGSPSESALRRWANYLQKNCNLLRNRSRKRQLVFECLLADADNSARKLVDSNPTGFSDRQADSTQPNSGAASSTKPDRQADTPKTPKADTHPVSGTNTLSSARTFEFIDKNWKPEDWADDWLRARGCPPHNPVDEVAEYILVCDAGNERSANFTSSFCLWLLRRHRRKQGEVKKGTGSPRQPVDGFKGFRRSGNGSDNATGETIDVTPERVDNADS